MQGAILAGGLGKRLRPLSEIVPKPLLFVGGKPMLDHALSACDALGLREVAIVASPFTREAITSHLNNVDNNIDIRVLLQEKPLGTADAVSVLENFVDDEVLVVSSDVTLNVPAMVSLVKFHREKSPLASILGVKVKDPSKYGVLLVNGATLTGVVEKPKEFLGDLVNSGIYVLSKYAVASAKDSPISVRGEKEITDTFVSLSKSGLVMVLPDNGSWWHDVGDFRNLLMANQYYLEFGLDQKGYVRGGDIKRVGKGTIIGPSFVADADLIEGEVGPYASLDSGAKIGFGCHVRNTVMMQGSGVLPAYSVRNAILAPGALATSEVHGTQEAPALIMPSGSKIRQRMLLFTKAGRLAFIRKI